MLVDDHEVVRVGMKTLLDRQEGFAVVAEAASEDEAVIEAKLVQPDIILMDIRLKSGSGIDACQRIMALLPKTRIIMLTSYAEDELLFAAIRAGAIGYVLKQVGSGDLIRAIQNAAHGDGSLDPSLTQKVFSQVRQSLADQESAAFDELTNQEKQVLLHISHGATNRQIAKELHLSDGTVRNYVSNILSKLHIHNRAEAAAYAIEHKLQDTL
jgi:DNA-binding NarL/FixJ family response regulator